MVGMASIFCRCSKISGLRGTLRLFYYFFPHCASFCIFHMEYYGEPQYLKEIKASMCGLEKCASAFAYSSSPASDPETLLEPSQAL